MTLVFFETPPFTRLLPGYLDDEGYHRLQLALMANPERGDLVPGTGEFRKMRWQAPKLGKGRRGGLRIIYYYLQAVRQIYLFSVYYKGEVDDMTPADKKALKSAIQAELTARRRHGQ